MGVTTPFTGKRQKDAITSGTLDKLGKAPEKGEESSCEYSVCVASRVFQFIMSYMHFQEGQRKFKSFSKKDFYEQKKYQRIPKSFQLNV